MCKSTCSVSCINVHTLKACICIKAIINRMPLSTCITCKICGFYQVKRNLLIASVCVCLLFTSFTYLFRWILNISENQYFYGTISLSITRQVVDVRSINQIPTGLVLFFSFNPPPSHPHFANPIILKSKTRIKLKY